MINILRRSLLNIYRIIQGYPPVISANLLLTNICTQNCLQCSIPQQKPKHPFISVDTAQNIIRKLNEWGTHNITLSGGEPILHPDLEEIVYYTINRKFSRIHLLTTLYGPDELVGKAIDLIIRSGISVSCSFDGFDDIADKLRGALNVSDTVKKNMLYLNRESKSRKRHITAGVNVTINEINLHQIIDIIKFVEDIGWHITLDIYRWLSENHEENDELKITLVDKLKPVIEYAIRSENVITPTWILKGFIPYLQGESRKICPYLTKFKLGSKLFINTDGEVFVCFKDSIGNLVANDLEAIFNSDKWKSRMHDFRICHGCWNTCYTLSAKMSSLISFRNIRNFINYYSDLRSSQK